MIMSAEKAKAISCLQHLLMKLGCAPKHGHIVIAQKMDLGSGLRSVYWTPLDWDWEE